MQWTCAVCTYINNERLIIVKQLLALEFRGSCAVYYTWNNLHTVSKHLQLLVVYVA